MESDMHFLLHVRVISCALIKIKFTHITRITRITFQLQWKLPMRHELGVLGVCHGDAGASLGTVRGSPGPDQEDLGCARYSHRGPFHGVGSKYVPMEKNRQIILNHPNFFILIFSSLFSFGPTILLAATSFRRVGVLSIPRCASSIFSGLLAAGFHAEQLGSLLGPSFPFQFLWCAFSRPASGVFLAYRCHVFPLNFCGVPAL